MPAQNIEGIAPDWPAPHLVRAFSTVRSGGVSKTPFHSLNLADYVGDERKAVAENRARLARYLSLPTSPVWLRQEHSSCVVAATRVKATTVADASLTNETGVVCAVLTADCLPVLLCDDHGSQVAAVHGGWRGLASGILQNTVNAMHAVPADLMAWMGPAIGPQAFEVGPEVRARFLQQDSRHKMAFRPAAGDRWMVDIYALARQILMSTGICRVYGGHWCTRSAPDHFFSYRRDRITGRMATVIWRNA
jgi:YfiH family protein